MQGWPLQLKDLSFGKSLKAIYKQSGYHLGCDEDDQQMEKNVANLPGVDVTCSV